jgi:DNA-directed RNA polymerase subunit L
MSSTGRKFQPKGKPGTTGVAVAPVPVAPQVFKNLIQKTREVITFTLAPTKVEFANTLRRAIETEVESVAFRADIMDDGTTGDVQMLKNSTPMSNEMIAHRVGLLPVHVANPLEWNPDEYSFELDVKNTSADPLDVKASDIKVFRKRGPDEEPQLVPNDEFFHPNQISQDTCLLAVLKARVGTQEPETLHFKAKATVGIGRENARFKPVNRCTCAYSLDTDQERRKEFFEKWLTVHKKVDPAELATNESRKKEMEREFMTMEVQRCYLEDEKGEPYSFDFHIESTGVLSPMYIVARALQTLEEKCAKYMNIEGGDLPENLQIKPADALMKGFDFVFVDEDYTLGCLLQTWMDTNQMDTKEIQYVGNKESHKLLNMHIVRIGVEDGKELTARTALSNAAKGCFQMFKVWEKEWERLGGTAAAVAPSATMRAALQKAAQARRFPQA